MRLARDTSAGRHRFPSVTVVLLVAMASGSGAAARTADEVRTSFDSRKGLACKRGYKCVEAKAEVVKDEVREGTGAVKTTWKSADDNYGLVSMSVAISETDLTGRSMAIKIKPPSRIAHIWGVEFCDTEGNRVEEHRIFHLGAGRWNTWNLRQGEKSKYGWIGCRKGDLSAGEGRNTTVPKMCPRSATRCHTVVLHLVACSRL